MGIRSDNTIRVGKYDYAILPYVSNRPEVLWGMEMTKNKTEAGMVNWVQRDMKNINLYNKGGGDLSTWPLWNAPPINADWDALGRLGLKWRTEVGVLRWRADGWVALRPSSSVAGAGVETWLTTRQIRPTGPSTLTINARCSEVRSSTSSSDSSGAGHCIRVEVMAENGLPLPAYSGENVARFGGDSVNSSLRWNGKAELPVGVVLSLNISLGVGAELFGFQLGSTSTRKRTIGSRRRRSP